MFYFLYGNDNKASRAKLRSLTETLHKKRPEAEVFRMHDDNWSDMQFEELLVAQGLFDQKYIALLEGLLEKKDSREKILEHVEDMKTSENVFLLIERDVDKKTIEILSKYATQVQEFVQAGGGTNGKDTGFGTGRAFNTFTLADAFGKRDKKNLWTGYLQAISLGISAEEITGVLFWQVKNIIIAKRTKDAKESKISPFADTKARGFAKNFSAEEIAKCANDLVEATKAVREGRGEMEILLERWVLSV